MNESFSKSYKSTNLRESVKAPKVLYHATYGKYFKQIKKDGFIKVNPPHKNWSFNDSYDNKHAIYLAGDYDVAVSYAETSEEVEDESMLDDIVVLTIDAGKLDQSQLEIDHNVVITWHDDATTEEEKLKQQTYEYYKDIPMSAVIDSELVEELNDDVELEVVGGTTIELSKIAAKLICEIIGECVVHDNVIYHTMEDFIFNDGNHYVDIDNGIFSIYEFSGNAVVVYNPKLDTCRDLDNIGKKSVSYFAGKVIGEFDSIREFIRSRDRAFGHGWFESGVKEQAIEHLNSILDELDNKVNEDINKDIDIEPEEFFIKSGNNYKVTQAFKDLFRGVVESSTQDDEEYSIFRVLLKRFEDYDDADFDFLEDYENYDWEIIFSGGNSGYNYKLVIDGEIFDDVSQDGLDILINKKTNINEDTFKSYKNGASYKEVINEIVPIGKFLYHGTFERNLDKIKKAGYIGGGNKNWGDSKSNVVYLTVNEDTAIEYCRRSSSYDEFEDNIVVLQIPVSKLDLNKLFVDTNEEYYFDEESKLFDVFNFEYGDKIPFSSVSKVITESINESAGDIKLRKFLFAKTEKDSKKFPGYDKYYVDELGGYLIHWDYNYNVMTRETDEEDWSHIDIKRKLPFELQKIITYGDGSAWGVEDFRGDKTTLFVSDGPSEKDVDTLKRIFKGGSVGLLPAKLSV